MAGEYFVRCDSLAWQELNNEVLILANEQGQVHELNEVAATIWKRLAAPSTRDDILDAILDEYDADPDEVRVDIQSTLRDWQNMALVKRVNP